MPFQDHPATLKDPFASMTLPGLPSEPDAPAAEPAPDFYARQIEAAKATLAHYETEIAGMVSAAAEIVVDSPESETAALPLGLSLDKLYKAIEKQRKELVEEPNAYVAAINSLARHYQGQIDVGRQTARKKLADYAQVKLLEARKAAEAERRARAEAQAKLDAEAAQATAEARAADSSAPEITAPKLPDAPPAETPKTIRAAEGKATVVTTWTFEVISPDEIPRQYLAVNEKAIRQAVKDGIRHIPGVRIFEDSNVRFGK